MAAAAESPLRDLRVLVTRPAAQAASLCARIENAGGHASSVPTIVIGPPVDPAAAGRALGAAPECLIFISRNAVEFAAKLVPDLSALLADREVFAAGEGTRLELSRRGATHAVAPDSDTGGDGLLRLDALQATAVSGHRVLIVRGEGGRELLREELGRRGANVGYAEVYSRRSPDAAALDEVWRGARPDIIVTTSNQGLENLVEITGGGLQDALFATPLVVTSPRARLLAAELGFRGPVAAAPAADDAAVLEALMNLAEEIRGR